MELLNSLARPQILKQNTSSYNELSIKITTWKYRLENIMRSINSQKSRQQLRGWNIRSLPPYARHSERQSINDNLSSISKLEQQIESVETSLEELLLSLLNPSEFEVLCNTVSQLKSLSNWHQKLIKLESMMAMSELPEAQTIIREATSIQRRKSSRNVQSSVAFPVQSMLLIVLALLVITKKFTTR